MKKSPSISVNKVLSGTKQESFKFTSKHFHMHWRVAFSSYGLGWYPIRHSTAEVIILDYLIWMKTMFYKFIPLTFASLQDVISYKLYSQIYQGENRKQKFVIFLYRCKENFP